MRIFTARRNHSRAPSTPCSTIPALLADQIPARLALILILDHAGPNHDALLRFVLHHPTKPNHLLPEVAWFFAVMIVRRRAGWAVTRATGITRPFVRFTVDLELDLLGCETGLAASTFHSLAAFANAGAESAAEVCAVPCPPCPYASVGCVVAAERLSALDTQPYRIVAVADILRQRRRNFVLVIMFDIRRLGKMVGERGGAARPTEATQAALQRRLRGRFDRAVLTRIVLASGSHPQRVHNVRTLQTTLQQRRHSLTMSRAHLPTFPRDMRPESALPWLSSRSTDCTLLGMTAPPPSMSFTVSMYSLSQRRVSRTSWWRNGERLAWNWRHVLESASRVFKSTPRAISLTILRHDALAHCHAGFNGTLGVDPRVAAQGRRKRIPVRRQAGTLVEGSGLGLIVGRCRRREEIGRGGSGGQGQRGRELVGECRSGMLGESIVVEVDEYHHAAAMGDPMNQRIR